MDADWVVRQRSDGCAVRPGPRRFAQAAWFRTDRPALYQGADGRSLPVSRGFFLLGGIAGSSESTSPVLTDLWLYDLHNVRDCPWIRVAADTGLASWAGTLVVDQVREELLLVGGERRFDGQRRSTSEVWSMPVDGGAVGGPPAWFAPTPDGEWLEPESISFEVQGDPYCATREWSCIDPSGVIVQQSALDVCTGGPALAYEPPDTSDTGLTVDCTPLNRAYDTRGCLPDPWCTQGAASEWRAFSSDGRAHGAAVYDEDLGWLQIFGGTEGVVGDEHAALHFLRPDGVADGGGELHAANLDAVTSVLSMSPGSPLEVVTGPVPAFEAHARKDPWPIDASTGLRDAAAVWWGRTFDRGELRWEPHDGEVLLLGGTRHQAFAPQVAHDLPGDQPCNVVGVYAEPCDVPAPGPGVPGSAVPDPWDAAELAAGTLLIHGDGSSTPNPAWAAGAGGRVAAAAIAVEGRTVAVIGGFDATHPYPVGSSSVTVVRSGHGEVPVDVPPAFQPRYGASAVWDPVTRTGWVFGGSDADDAVWTLSSPSTIEPNVDSTWEMDDVELSLVRDGAVWHVQAGFRAVHHCEAPVFEEQGDPRDPTSPDDCFADQLTLLFPGLGLPADVQVVAQRVTADSAILLVDPTAALAAEGELVRDEFRSFASAVVALPVAIPPEGIVELTVAYDLYAADAAANGVPGLGQEGYGAYDTTTGGGAAAQQIVGLPVVLARSAAEPATRALVDVRRTHVSTPLAEVFGPGDRVTCAAEDFDLIAPGALDGACHADLPPLPGSKLAWTALDGVTLAAERPTAHTTLRIWVDVSLDAALVGQIAVAGPSLEADLDWLVDHLGAWPGGTTEDVVYVAFSDDHGALASGPVAEAFPGAVFVSALPRPLVPEDAQLDPALWMPITVHELAHAWWGIGTSTGPGADWLREAVPSLLQVMRYPDVQDAEVEGAQSRLEDGLIEVVNEPRTSAIEDQGNAYTVGALTVADLLTTQVAAGASEDEAFALLRGLLDEAPTTDRDLTPSVDCVDVLPVGRLIRDERPTITHDDLAAALDALFPAFHCEKVHFGRVGFPLVGVEGYDGVGPDVAVEIGQVQDELLGWPLFTDVPYHLLCDPVVPDDAVPAACTGGELALTGPPRLLAGASERVPLGSDEQTLYLGLLAADQLLPEQAAPWSLSVNDALGRARTLLARCAPGDDAPPCDVDLDADGYPAEGDCDDGDPTRNPGVDAGLFGDDGSESVTLEDLNCDGWPTSRFPGAP